MFQSMEDKMKRKRNRRTYKNLVAIAIASFTSIALISTGLAAFVLVRESQVETEGNIVVGEIVDNQITLTLPTVTRSIILEPEKNDKYGYIQSDGIDPVLTHTVTGDIKVESGDNRTVANVDLKYRVNIKNDGGSVANDDFIDDFIDANRLSFVTPFAGLSAENTLTITPDANDDKEGSFSFTFGFVWGTEYNSKNPSVHYDDVIDALQEKTPANINGVLATATDEISKLQEIHGYTFEIVIFAKFKAN